MCKFPALPQDWDIKKPVHVSSCEPVGADPLAWYWWGSTIEFMMPLGILREPERSITNGNIWRMGRITDAVQFIISEMHVICMCLPVTRVPEQYSLKVWKKQHMNSFEEDVGIAGYSGISESGMWQRREGGTGGRVGNEMVTDHKAGWLHYRARTSAVHPLHREPQFSCGTQRKHGKKENWVRKYWFVNERR